MFTHVIKTNKDKTKINYTREQNTKQKFKKVPMQVIINSKIVLL